jgi:hypothetical protein
MASSGFLYEFSHKTERVVHIREPQARAGIEAALEILISRAIAATRAFPQRIENNHA